MPKRTLRRKLTAVAGYYAVMVYPQWLVNTRLGWWLYLKLLPDAGDWAYWDHDYGFGPGVDPPDLSARGEVSR